jgi:hypothetical protein
MDIKDVKHLVKVITETDITEFEMENGQEKIVIRRGQRTEVVHVAPTFRFSAFSSWLYGSVQEAGLSCGCCRGW